MHIALTRRRLLAFTAVTALAAACRISPAFAKASGANAFVKSFADELVGIVNGPDGNAQKKAALGPVIDGNVDVARLRNSAWAVSGPLRPQPSNRNIPPCSIRFCSTKSAAISAIIAV